MHDDPALNKTARPGSQWGGGGFLVLGTVVMVLAFGISLLPGCSSTRPPTAMQARTDGLQSQVLEILADRTHAMRSLTCAGTLLIKWETERHFVHFEAAYLGPDMLRLDLELSGPLGLGAGDLHYVERGDSAEVLLPGESFPRRGRTGGPEFDFLQTKGFPTRDATFLVAPYAGSPELFAAENVIHMGPDTRSGRIRLVLVRPDRLREVLLLEPPGFSLVERRVTRPGGEVLLVSRYDYGDDPASLTAEKVDNEIPGESSIQVRFRELVSNAPIDEGRFAWFNGTR